MANHADHRGVQESGAVCIRVLFMINRSGEALRPARIAMVNEAGMVPLLQHAAAMGFEHATSACKVMGVCPGYRQGWFTSKCKCGKAKDAH